MDNVLLNVVNGKAFEMTTLTGVIIRMPRLSNKLSGVLQFTPKKSFTTSFQIDTVSHRMGVLPTLGRDAPLPNAAPSEADLISFKIPRTGRHWEVTVSEVMERRKPGTTEFWGLDDLAAQKLMLANREIELWSLWQRYRALDGLVANFQPSKDGTHKVLQNVLKLMGLQQRVFKFDFTSATLDINEQIGVLSRMLGDDVGGSPVNIVGWKILCGRKFYRILRKLPSVQKAWNLYTQLKNLKSLGMTDVQIPGGFALADDITVHDLGDDRYPVMNSDGEIVDWKGMIDDYSAYLVPVVQDGDFYVEAFGPSTKLQFFGQVLPRYVLPMLKQDGTGIAMDVECISLNYVERPDLIYKLTMTDASKALYSDAGMTELDVAEESVPA